MRLFSVSILFICMCEVSSETSMITSELFVLGDTTDFFNGWELREFCTLDLYLRVTSF